MIDGEVVALDDEGRSSFQLLQGREMKREKEPVYFYVFDLLQAEGRSLLAPAVGNSEKPGWKSSARKPAIRFAIRAKSEATRTCFSRK